MPRQETFFKESAGLVTVEVIKTYDPSYAREVFDGMSEEAVDALLRSLELEKRYAPDEIPKQNGPGFDEFLWGELNEESLEDAREYPRKYSFFIVTVSKDGKSEDRFVCADWPSAERFAKLLLQHEA